MLDVVEVTEIVPKTNRKYLSNIFQLSRFKLVKVTVSLNIFSVRNELKCNWCECIHRQYYWIRIENKREYFTCLIMMETIESRKWHNAVHHRTKTFSTTSIDDRWIRIQRIQCSIVEHRNRLRNCIDRFDVKKMKENDEFETPHILRTDFNEIICFDKTKNQSIGC